MNTSPTAASPGRSDSPATATSGAAASGPAGAFELLFGGAISLPPAPAQPMRAPAQALAKTGDPDESSPESAVVDLGNWLQQLPLTPLPAAEPSASALQTPAAEAPSSATISATMDALAHGKAARSPHGLAVAGADGVGAGTVLPEGAVAKASASLAAPALPNQTAVLLRGSPLIQALEPQVATLAANALNLSQGAVAKASASLAAPALPNQTAVLLRGSPLTQALEPAGAQGAGADSSGRQASETAAPSIALRSESLSSGLGRGPASVPSSHLEAWANRGMLQATPSTQQPASAPPALPSSGPPTLAATAAEPTPGTGSKSALSSAPLAPAGLVSAAVTRALLQRTEQPATMATSSASAPPAAAGSLPESLQAPLTVALPPGSAPKIEQAFAEGMGIRLQWMAQQQVGRAEIQLDPADLGSIDVQIEFDGKSVRAEFQSPLAEVRQLLESTLPRLRDLLEAQGLQLQHAGVGDEAGREAQRQQSAPEQARFGSDVAGAEAPKESPPAMRPLHDGGLSEYA